MTPTLKCSIINYNLYGGFINKLIVTLCVLFNIGLSYSFSKLYYRDKVVSSYITALSYEIQCNSEKIQLLLRNSATTQYCNMTKLQWDKHKENTKRYKKYFIL